MKIEGNTIYFKSEPEYFQKEIKGLKCNTVRWLNWDEYADLTKFTYLIDKKISISCNDRSFIRKITDISKVGFVINLHLIVISWKHEEEGE